MITKGKILKRSFSLDYDGYTVDIQNLVNKGKHIFKTYSHHTDCNKGDHHCKCDVYIQKRTQSLKENSLIPEKKMTFEKFNPDVVTVEKSDDFDALDGNWGWIIVLSSFLIQFILIGFDGCSGILYLKFKDRFQKSSAITAWLGSLATALRLLLGPLASALSNRFSERTVIMASGIILSLSMILTGLSPNIYYTFLSFGLLGGIGRSFAYYPAIVMVGMYFKKKQGLATGIAASGSGAGGFAMTLLVALLFHKYDYMSAFVLLGGIALEVVALGALMRPLELNKRINKRKSINKDNNNLQTAADNNNCIKPESVYIIIPENKSISSADNVKIENDTKTKVFDLSVLKNVRFLGFCITMLLSSLAEQTAFVFLPAFAQEVSDHGSEYTVAIISVFSSLAKILTGFIFDCPAVQPYRVYLYNGLMSCLVVISFLIPSVTTFSELTVICAMYGLLAGSYKAQKSVVVVDILGRDKLAHSYGLLMMFQGFGSLIGPPISGLFKDLNGRYDVVFYLGGTGLLVGTLIMSVNNIVHYINTKRDQKTANRISNLKIFTAVNLSTVPLDQRKFTTGRRSA